MATSDESLQLSFPLPPSKYYKIYTDENVKNGQTPSPPPPVQGQYSMFGAIFETGDDIIRPLESQGIPKLYGDNYKDKLAEMKKLNHSILVNFLELLDVLIESPSTPERERKLDDINVLFINLHHLINEFRPHQARETLRVMLHRQKLQRLDTAEKLKKHIDKAKVILRNCHATVLSLQNSSSAQQRLDIEMKDTSEDTLSKDAKVSEDDVTILDSILCDMADNVT